MMSWRRIQIILLLLFISVPALAQIVTIPIPGAPGLNVTVGVGANALPLQNIQNNPNAVNITTGDDSYTQVPLGFTFPMFGQSFTNSWAATNGFVTFRDPAVSGLWGGCCEGVDLSKTTDPAYNYTIYGLHTDLYSWNGANQWYLKQGNSMTYGWYNISQCCGSEGGNSFEIKIDSSGLIDTRIAGALVSWNRVTSGMAGDLSKGEYYQYYHGQGISIPAGSPGIFSWQALSGTGADQCVINPLSSPSCPGYAAAYLTQQCTISALYSPSCPGYQQAYFTQQCTIDPLYNSACPGYQQAYYEQQCSINPLYDSGCTGYQQAYYTQQCSINPLYDSGCTGYQEAYVKKNILNVGSTPTTTTTTTTETTAVKTDPVAIATTSTTTSTTSPTSVTSVTSVISGGTSSATTAVVTSTSTQSTTTTTTSPTTTTTEVKKVDSEVKSATAGSTGGSAKSRAEARAREVAKSASEARTFEAQAATQSTVVGLMGFVPGFDAYSNARIVDVNGQQMARLYNKPNVDNRSVLRQINGASDRLHQEMVDQQYRR